MICHGGPLDGYDLGDSCPVESNGFRYVGPGRDYAYQPIGDALFYAGTLADVPRRRARAGCAGYFSRFFSRIRGTFLA